MGIGGLGLVRTFLLVWNLKGVWSSVVAISSFHWEKLEKGGAIERHELVEESSEIDYGKMDFALKNLLLKMNLIELD